MKKYILFLLLGILYSRSALAAPMKVDLGQMFSDYKENEYVFKQKYSDKELQFEAIISSIKPDCYTNLNGKETPCIKLEHKTSKVTLFDMIPTSIGKAVMHNNNDLANLTRKQEITLICRLREKDALFETSPLAFENCKIADKEYSIDEEIKKEIKNSKINELKVTEQENCGTNCTYTIDNKGFILIKPIDNTQKAYIAKAAFNAKKNFTRVKIEEGIVSIGERAFSETNLVKIDLPDSLTSIGKEAFSSTKLKKIKIPDNITTIEKWAFYASGLREVILPKNLKKIEYDAFAGCNFITIDIPDSVTTIGDNAFDECHKLENVKLPASLESIGREAFYGTNLTKIDLPESLKTIGRRAFCGTNISEVDIPDSVLYIDGDAFTNDELLTIIISDTTEVSDYAFGHGSKSLFGNIDSKVNTVYCRGDVDICKENLENAVSETTEFKSLSEMNKDSDTPEETEAEQTYTEEQ